MPRRLPVCRGGDACHGLNRAAGRMAHGCQTARLRDVRDGAGSRPSYSEREPRDERTMGQARFFLPADKIADFCRRHRIRKLSLFGSVLRNDFRPDSDIDVLVEFEPEARTGLAFFAMEIEAGKRAITEFVVQDLVAARRCRMACRSADLRSRKRGRTIYYLFHPGQLLNRRPSTQATWRAIVFSRGNRPLPWCGIDRRFPRFGEPLESLV